MIEKASMVIDNGTETYTYIAPVPPVYEIVSNLCELSVKITAWMNIAFKCFWINETITLVWLFMLTWFLFRGKRQ